jgi:hypothetical protein
MQRRASLYLAAWAVFSLVVGLLYANLPLYIDQYWYEYIGGAWLAGELPYVEAGDQNYPGAGLMHALSLLMFGAHSWTFRVFDYLILLGFVVAFGRALAIRQGLTVAAIFVPLYQLVYVTSGAPIAGQRDVLAAQLVLAGGGFLFERIRGGRLFWMAAAGLSVFCAALLKPTYAVFAAVLPVVDLIARPGSGRSLRRIAADHALAVSVMAAGAAVLLLIGWRMGVLQAWYEYTVVFNADIYTFGERPPMAVVFAWVGGRFLKYWAVYTAAALVGGLLWLRDGDRPLLALLAATCAMVVGSSVLQARMLDYHLAAVLPALTALIANALAWSLRQLAAGLRRLRAGRPSRWRELWPAAVAGLLLLGTTLAVAKKVVGVYRVPVAWRLGLIGDEAYAKHYEIEGVSRVIDFVKGHTAPGDRIWTWTDLYPEIYNHSGRRAVTRFALPVFVVKTVAPLRVADRWQAEVCNMMRDHPPRLIITRFIDPEKVGGRTGVYEFPPPPGYGPMSPVYPVLEDHLKRNYRRVASIKSFEIHELVQ